MKKVIITGITGFVGRYLAQEMLQQGYDVTGVARNPAKVPAQLTGCDRFHLVESTLEELEAAAFPQEHYDAFFHFAWGGVNRDEIDDPSVHAHNYENSVRCLQTAKALGCAFFLDAGSRMEYGYVDGVMTETLEPHPDKAYGIWKERFYRYAYDYCREQSLSYVHIRIFSVIGVGDHPWSITETACRKLSCGEKMEFGPCTQLWNFMAIEDAAKAIRLLYEKRDNFPEQDNRIVNVANYDTRVLRGFIEEIFQITHSKSELVFHEGSAGTSTNADVAKLSRITGWKSEIPYYQQIIKILNSYSGNAS